jgi:hypothetical protein
MLQFCDVNVVPVLKGSVSFFYLEEAGRQSFWGWRLELELQPAKSKSQGFGPLIIARAPPTPPTSSGGTYRRTIKPKLGFIETDRYLFRECA